MITSYSFGQAPGKLCQMCAGRLFFSLEACRLCPQGADTEIYRQQLYTCMQSLLWDGSCHLWFSPAALWKPGCGRVSIHSQLVLRRWQQRSVSKPSRSRWFSVEGSRAVPVISMINVPSSRPVVPQQNFLLGISITFVNVTQLEKKVNLTNILTLKQPAATEKNKQTRQDRQVAGDVVMDVVNGWSQDVMRH